MYSDIHPNPGSRAEVSKIGISLPRARGEVSCGDIGIGAPVYRDAVSRVCAPRVILNN